MFLNDAFDRDFDRREPTGSPNTRRRCRRRRRSLLTGSRLLALGFVILLALAYAIPGRLRLAGAGRGRASGREHRALRQLAQSKSDQPGDDGALPLLVYVDRRTCRCWSALSGRLVLAAIVSLCYLIGLTYRGEAGKLAADQNRLAASVPRRAVCLRLCSSVASVAALVLYVLLLVAVIGALSLSVSPAAPDVPHAVMLLIAGISLLDGLFMAGHGQPVARRRRRCARFC